MSQSIAESRKANIKKKLRLMTIFKVKKRQVKHRDAYRAPALRQQLTAWLTNSPIGHIGNGANIVFAVAQLVQTRGRSHHPIGR